jgi:hypothetical protein
VDCIYASIKVGQKCVTKRGPLLWTWVGDVSPSIMEADLNSELRQHKTYVEVA